MGLVVMFLGVWLAVPALAWSQFFDNARQAVNIQTSTQDYSGMSMRGGINLSTGAAASSTTLFRSQARVGGSCSAFDFGASFKEAMEAIPDVVQQLAEELIQAAPLILTCNLLPILCDVGKHFQALMNSLIQARYAQCQGAQHAAMYAGLRLRTGQVSRCLEERYKAGDTLNSALDYCNKSAFDLIGPDGLPTREINVIQDSLQFAGASGEVQTLASHMLGEVTLRAGNAMGVDSRRTADALQGTYEGHKQRYETALRTATEELASTGQLSAPTARAIAVPGRPLSRATVDALVVAQHDPVAYATHLGQLSTGMALTQLTTDCAELETTLAAAVAGNGNMGEAEREEAERLLANLRRGLAQFMARTEVITKHVDPAVDALLARYSAMQAHAIDLGLRAPTVTIPAQPYRTQTPMGYSR